MKPEEVLALVNAGYTKAEIEQMSNPAPAPAPAPAPDPAPVPDPVPAPAPAPDPAPAPESGNAEILSAIKALENHFTAAMQAASLSAAMLKNPSEGDTLESVMAQIIQPTPPKSK